MRLRITAILSQQPPQMVEFATEFGTGKGLWMSGDVLAGNEYHVEFEFIDQLKWGENLSLASTDEFTLASNDATTFFHAKIEHIDDMLYTIRFGTALFMVDSDRHHVEADYAGKTICIKVQSDRLFLHDINL